MKINIQEDDFRPIGRMAQVGYGAYNAYMSAATRYAALGAPTLYDHPGPLYGSKLSFKHTHLLVSWIIIRAFIKFFGWIRRGTQSGDGQKDLCWQAPSGSYH